MLQTNETFRYLRRSALARCIARYLGCASACVGATSLVAATSAAASQTWIVLNCSDSAVGSLRDIITNNAQSGDFIDLSSLPNSCGGSSTLALSSGEISIPQADLTLVGPKDSRFAIKGSATSRVFNHMGSGTLKIDSLEIREGHFSAPDVARGGCISSVGEVYLSDSTITGCTVNSVTNHSYGGGVYAQRVHLVRSHVTHNQASAEGGESAGGGGVFCNVSLLAKYSEISSNISHDGAVAKGFGGGIAATGSVNIFSSTIDSNVAGFGGGISAHIVAGDAIIQNSTISGNFASEDYAAATISADYFEIGNSTIAFNYSTSSFSGPQGALALFSNTHDSRLSLDSTIVANNTATAAGVPSDVYLGYVFDANARLVGADNLVIASNASAVAPGVIVAGEDPQLLPLAISGGWTRTHRLRAGSPAVGFGNNSRMLVLDQRGYSRTTGANAVVDIGAVQSDPLFRDGFD